MVSSGGSDDHTGDGIELAQTTIDMLALISALGGEGEFATATVVTAAVLQTLVDFYNNFMGISSSSSDGLYPTGNGVYGTYASMTLSDIRAGPTGDAYITTTNTQTLLERDAKFSLLNQDYGTNEGFTMTFSFTLKAVIGYYPLSCYLACNTNYYPVTLVSFSTSIPFIVNIYQS